MNIDKEKISKYFLIGLGVLVIGSFIRDLFIYEPKLREKGKYTVGYIYKYSRHKGGATIFYEYKVGNKLWYSSSVDGEAEKLLYKRFLVRYVYDEVDLSEILLQYPVPDSIKTSPPNGWKDLPEWAVR